MVIEKKKWTPKPKEPSSPEGTKLPHQIPDPPPPSKEPETPREPNVVSTKIEPKVSKVEESATLIRRAIKLLDDVNSNEATLAIGKLKGALIKLGL